ncbi:MAG: hypothetical protein QOH90_1243 [Actinomycetota bacterium]|jgi:hypothetical protein|nr:hypothetical protein [Actinomycetota bacterium]
MSRSLKVIGAALAAVLILAGVALAALPKPGGIYKGPTSDKGHVKIVAETKHNLSLVRVKDKCDEVYKFHNVKVADNGTFKAKDKNSSGIVIFSVSGQFSSNTKAEGETSQVACDGESTFFTAKLVQ